MLNLATWTLYLTDLPDLSVDDAHPLARARWPIELLFKLWKSPGGLWRTRSADPVRQPLEGYAKLLGLLIAHWSLLIADWDATLLSPADALTATFPFTELFRYLRLVLATAAPRQSWRARPLAAQLWADFSRPPS